jgi:catechol 2,3-dioxygenase-like lactoylglutathione lyase family enzyme
MPIGYNFLTASSDGCYNKPMKIRHVDHVGMVVNDIEAAKAFFVDLGFTFMGQTTVEGEWAGRVIGLDNVLSDIVMLQAPDGQVNLELSKFHQPEAIDSMQTASNTLGLRHIAFQVEDIEGIVEALEQKGRKLVGDIQTYEDAWKLCYVQGPEGILIELAEQL